MHSEKAFVNIIVFKSLFQSRVQSEKAMGKSTSILDGVCVNYEQLLHPVQCTVSRKFQCSSKDKLILPELTGILSFLDQLQYL